MSNPYYSPERYGLEKIAEFGEYDYSWSLFVVWRSLETGQLYYADDSGCSCDSPFESHGLYPTSTEWGDELIPAIDFDQVADAAIAWAREHTYSASMADTLEGLGKLRRQLVDR